MSNPLVLDKKFPVDLRAFLKAKDLSKNAFSIKYEISDGTLNLLLDGKTDKLRQVTRDKLAKIMKDKKWPHRLVTADVPPPPLRVHSKISDHIANPADLLDKLAQAGIPAELKDGASSEGRAEIPVDFKQFVTDSAYIPRDLLLFVIGYPEAMPQPERDQWKALIELHVGKFEGLVSGSDVVYDEDTDTFVESPMIQAPWLVLKEKFGKPFRRMLDSFYQQYVKGRTAEAIYKDGLSIVALEPDVTGTIVLDAWLIDGVVFGNTGCLQASRDISAPKKEPPEQLINLYSVISQGESIHKLAVKLLDKINSPIFNLS
jgi:hypothetical protein